MVRMRDGARRTRCWACSTAGHWSTVRNGTRSATRPEADTGRGSTAVKAASRKGAAARDAGRPAGHSVRRKLDRRVEPAARRGPPEPGDHLGRSSVGGQAPPPHARPAGRRGGSRPGSRREAHARPATPLRQRRVPVAPARPQPRQPRPLALDDCLRQPRKSTPPLRGSSWTGSAGSPQRFRS